MSAPAGAPADWARTFRLIETSLRSGHPEPASVGRLAVEGASPSGAASPFRVLVSTVISARTREEVTLASSRRLLARAPDPAALAALEEGEIASLIRPAGFYRTKAAHLRQLAAMLLERFGAEVPADLPGLLQLPGVGRKTANLVLNLGFGRGGICVDTHVHRIANRLGWVCTASPAATEPALQAVLPRR